MTVPLGEMLERALVGEPAPADEVAAVFRRADALRRRRVRLVLVAGAVIVGTVALGGYLVTTTLLPVRSSPRADSAAVVRAGSGIGRSAVPVPSAIADPVLAALAPAVDAGHLRIVPRPPQRGFGWRQYSVLTADGKPRGTVGVAVYARPDRFCFPRRDGHTGCASADHAAGGIDYVRYDDAEPDWQVNQTIARRAADGRTIALMAAGERDVTDPADGRPALSARQIERLATDPRLMAAFGPRERCDGAPAEACPVFRVPVPPG
jgi:hypothetical protein